jgi:3-methyladenine DNA glycosylase AlkC
MQGFADHKPPEYTHTQKAPLCLILYGVAVGCFALACWVGDAPGIYVAGGVGLLIALLAPAFHHLTVVDQGEVLAIWFGPVPLFRRNVRYSDIGSVEVGRTLLLDGWGIHMSVRGGWVRNFTGMSERMSTQQLREPHPSQKFIAPSSIQHGVPLKELLDGNLVALIGESLAETVPGFDIERFHARAVPDLDKLELKERALCIAHAMAEQMPASFDELSPLLIKSLGPPLRATEGNGLAPFFYFPHAHLIAAYGVSSFNSGMTANYEITKRFTAEFSIRPFLIEHRSKCLKVLKRWARDDNPHVRRLVSEGTRPRLPWAMRLPEFQADPNLSLPLLEMLKDDPELYVRRSVANHLGDIAKDHLETALDVCEKWLKEQKPRCDDAVAENRRWIVRHAVRHPAKKEHARAIEIRALASTPKKKKGR